MEFIFKVLIFSGFIAVISTAAFGSYNSDEALRVLRSQLQSSHTCLDNFSLPLTSVLYGSNNTFNQVCGQRLDGSSYFSDCENQFITNCKDRGCDYDKLLPWVQGFPRAAMSYICVFGFNAINDIQTNGGRDCMADVGLDISAPLLNLYGSIWNGQSLSCRNVSNYMNDVSKQLNSCDKKDLRNVVVKYFDEVVNLTPCKGDISPGAATNVPTNLFLCVVAILASVFIALKRQ